MQGIEATGGMLALSEQRRKQTTKTIDSSKEQFDETQADNQQKLDEVLAQIDGLERKIPDLNKKVIDSVIYINHDVDMFSTSSFLIQGLRWHHERGRALR